MAKTQDSQSGPQDAAKNAPAEADNITEVIMEAAQAAMDGAPDADSKVQNAIAVLARAHTETLIKATQAVINGEPDAEIKLQWMITQFLCRDCDELITQAQVNASPTEIAGKIGEVTRIVAINAFHRHGPGNEEVQQVKLLAIPLMLTLPYSEYKEVPRALSQADTDRLAQAFAAHGLMDPVSEQILLAPQLWRAEEIHNLPYSKVWALAQAFSNAMVGETTIAPEDILGIQVAPQETAPDRVNICLRYVIGAFAHPYESEPSAIGKEDTEAKLEAWHDETAQYLSSKYHCKAEVCGPGSLYEALEDGWIWCHISLLLSQLADALRHYRLLPREITAVISLHAIEDDGYQFHISYTQYDESGKPKLLGGSIWPLAPFEDPNETADVIKQSLDKNGIAAVEIADAVQAGYSGENGTPFLLPKRQAIPDPNGCMPAPAQLQ